MSSLRAKRRLRTQEDVSSKDRISALPDDLLFHILSHVSTEVAVATMILSKRWRFVWTMVPKLEFTLKHTDDEIKRVCRFVDKSMELNKEPVLDSFRIHLNNRRVDASKWIENAVDRHVRVLELADYNYGATVLTRLPESLYTSKTLVELTLSICIVVNVPSSTYLPSLRKLCLVLVCFKDQDSLVRLVSGCSNLARSTSPLSIANNWEDTPSTKRVQLPCMRVLKVNANIWSQKLNKLPESLYTCTTLVEMALYYCILVDVPSSAYLPSLKKLLLAEVNYKDEDSLVRLISSCSVLTRSTIRLSIGYEIDTSPIKQVPLPCIRVFFHGYDYQNQKFRRSLSLVTSLTLYLPVPPLNVDFSGITFSRLERFKLHTSSNGWSSLLLQVLNNSPKLRFLHIHTIVKTPLSCKTPSSIPECLSSQLEVFEWKNYSGREETRDNS